MADLSQHTRQANLGMQPVAKLALARSASTNIIPGCALKTEPVRVAIITSMIHCCMGGLEIKVNSAVAMRKPDACNWK